MSNIKNLKPILERAEKLFKAGNSQKSYEVCLTGLQECSQVNKELNEKTQGWDLKESFDYKGKYKVQGKKLELWMEKFWNIIEDNDLDLVYSEPITIENFKTILLYNKETKEQVYYTH